MSWLSNLFGGGHNQNPANAAMPYFNQMKGEYLSPEGYNTIASQYKPSPGFDWRLKQALGGIKNAQGAGGMLGSLQHQQEAGGMAEHLADQDFENYMRDRLGIGSDMSGMLSQQGNLAFGGTMFDNKKKSDQISQLLSLIGTGAGAGLGFMAGGPFGAASGGSYGSHWFGG